MATEERDPFYFEMTHAERMQFLEGGGTFPVEEGYVAHDLNWARTVVRIPSGVGELPDLLPPPEGERPEVYSDAVAALLQAARYEGLEPQVVIDHAVSTMEAVWSDSTSCAAGRASVGGVTR